MMSLVPKAMLLAALAAFLPATGQEAQAAKAEPTSPKAAEPKAKSTPKTTPKTPSSKAKPKSDPSAKAVLGTPNPKAPMTPATKVPLPSTKKPAKIPYEKRVNLNGASREELMKLPTVDAATADRIIAGRPYKVSADLLLNNIVPGAHFYTLKGLVTAGKYTGPAKK